LFPDRRVSVRKIGLTYSIMNLVQPFLSGIPTCHGSGGLAGHYAFGARTGGSVIIYGSMYLAVGLFLSKGFNQVMQIFPLPILGVILLFEALALMSLARDITRSKPDMLVALVVALPAALTTVGLPDGFLIGLVAGLALAYAIRKGWIFKSAM
jgi:MFS superfamily sulfate permease-like transporter